MEGDGGYSFREDLPGQFESPLLRERNDADCS
jgi:hypothetical protein